MLEPDLDWLADAITRRTGLIFPTSRRSLLERAVDRWLATADDATRDRFDHRILPSERPWQQLLSHVTVGETYFFRHEEQLDALRREILPALVEARLRDSDRSLRVWSAGCSTGAEAYTLAMIVAESIPDARRWSIRVFGTDIDEEALGVARAATYGRWALRVDGEYRTRWLRHTASGQEVDPAIRSLVRFGHHNLVASTDWPPAGLDGPADLILCRNVTMYMAAATARAVTEDFRRALAPGGWLLLGPAEPAPETGFVRRSIGGFVFSQRPAAYGTPIETATVVSRRAPIRTPLPTARSNAGRGTDRPRHPSASTPLMRPSQAAIRSSEAQPVAHSDAEKALALADAGRLDEAESLVRRQMQVGPPSAWTFALLATIAEARGDLDASCQALGRALYLDPTDPLSLFRLGLLEWRRTRLGQARTRMRGALAALEGRPDADLVDQVHGITAGAIRGIARSLLS